MEHARHCCAIWLADLAATTNVFVMGFAIKKSAMSRFALPVVWCKGLLCSWCVLFVPWLFSSCADRIFFCRSLCLLNVSSKIWTFFSNQAGFVSLIRIMQLLSAKSSWYALAIPKSSLNEKKIKRIGNKSTLNLLPSRAKTSQHGAQIQWCGGPFSVVNRLQGDGVGQFMCKLWCLCRAMRRGLLWSVATCHAPLPLTCCLDIRKMRCFGNGVEAKQRNWGIIRRYITTFRVSLWLDWICVGIWQMRIYIRTQWSLFQTTHNDHCLLVNTECPQRWLDRLRSRPAFCSGAHTFRLCGGALQVDAYLEPHNARIHTVLYFLMPAPRRIQSCTLMATWGMRSLG